MSPLVELHRVYRIAVSMRWECVSFRHCLRLLLIAVCALPVSAIRAEDSIDFDRDLVPVIEKHCVGCHGPSKQQGDIRLDNLTSDLLSDRRAAETWHDVLNVLNRGEMPPEDEPPLSERERREFVAWLTNSIEQAAKAQRESGSNIVLRRLNRVEYRNTMTDLLGIKLDYARDLPPDSLSPDGFKNHGATLNFTDLQFEYYLKAARQGLSLAIVTDRQPHVFHERFTESSKDKGPGPWTTTLGSTGMFVARMIEFPHEGEFVIRIRARAVLHPEKDYPQLSVCLGYRADVSAPFSELALVDVISEQSQTYEFRARIEDFPLPSEHQSNYPGMLIWLRNVYNDGQHPQKVDPFTVRTAEIKKAEIIKNPNEYKEYPQIEIESVEFEGPSFSQWPPKSHSTIIFESALRADNESAYAREVLSRFISRAFRRPLEENEIEPYFAHYQTIRQHSDTLEAALREVLAMVLISPDFLYLVEPKTSSGKRPLNDYELASRLSYFLFASMPDDELRRCAEQGTLKDPTELRRQVRRMIQDKRAWQFVEQFTDQWLDLGSVDRVAVNPEFYPEFDDARKNDMRHETQHFFAELLLNDLSALNLLDSDFTMLNQPLARFYGLTGPKGRVFERVPLHPDDHRGGLLTHGAILLGNSTGTDSHPVKRAVWIRERLLDDPPASPPPNVPVLDSSSPQFAKLSVREQMELHRHHIACADCHQGIDPWGIALENFGADGLWREQILRKEQTEAHVEDRFVAVDAESTLPDGTKVNGAEDLKRYLLEQRRDQFAKALTSKLLAYALGRSLELGDEAELSRLTEHFANHDYKLSSLIEEIVISEPFTSK